ncbi:helix-turn-helix domain-containing protein [Candidatus Chloroploca sp. M-50]|uniref:Helix-turn-helix domain-containing protein n=1 Tax=Candidatus Chloroploca mongolica TaxID=2528176 RepID=A0ABS4DBA8_9CHLR|nr:helix-turn-helix domain-containing protein [Candidatus Chloroploca mongolica]MBP1466738.1 helix-turn-helix domain-containing protein [Candidatus Chloroploca mongolica]
MEMTKPEFERSSNARESSPVQVPREPLQVTIREAAALLSYDPRTIRRLITQGELTAIGRGKLRRIAMADLRAYQVRNRC